MLILIAHGSRDAGWRGSLEALAESVRSRNGLEEIRLAFMQFTGPTLPEVVKEAWADGVRDFRILPLFMASAGHVDKDIRPLLEELALRFPGSALHLLAPIGENPRFHDLVWEIANDHRS